MKNSFLHFELFLACLAFAITLHEASGYAPVMHEKAKACSILCGSPYNPLLRLRGPARPLPPDSGSPQDVWTKPPGWKEPQNPTVELEPWAKPPPYRPNGSGGSGRRMPPDSGSPQDVWTKPPGWKEPQNPTIELEPYVKPPPYRPK